mmetsp:Transcript_33654/g.50896  ORF Transcript_33654/g.50896 Transcript_33654/m.50896 type:complete len:178 (+) Transcript_33654:63-596(+)
MASTAAATPIAQDTMSTTQPLKRKDCDVVSKVSAPKRFCLAVTACPRRGVSLSVGATRKVGSLTAKALYSTTAPLRWVIRKTLKRKSAVKDAEERKNTKKELPKKVAEAKKEEGKTSPPPAVVSTPAPAAAIVKEVKVEEKIVEIHVEAEKMGAGKKSKNAATTTSIDSQMVMQAGA